jgi:predicted nucleic acid-binding protein
MIISDAGPIIIFARIKRLPLLREVVGSLIIPAAVHHEIVVNKGGMLGAAEVAQAAWIQSAAVADRSILDTLPRVLHEGEREAIALAKERGAQLLVDEFVRGVSRASFKSRSSEACECWLRQSNWVISILFGQSLSRCKLTGIASTEP